MAKHLFLICPLDFLEFEIRKNYKDKCFFYSSLGNSISYNNQTIDELIDLIKNEEISLVSMVMSNENEIISNSLKKAKILSVGTKKQYQHQIIGYETVVNEIWEKCDVKSVLTARYLEDKIMELKDELKKFDFNLEMNPVLYDRKSNTFSNVTEHYTKIQTFHLN